MVEGLAASSTPETMFTGLLPIDHGFLLGEKSF
jgi:hypothetical protein